MSPMQTIIDGNIRSLKCTNEDKTVEREFHLSGDELIIPNIINWNGETLFIEQIILNKELFKQMYKRWILEDTSSNSLGIGEIKMDYYDPNYNGIMNEGWICPRCGRVNAPWMPNCTCDKIKITYTRDTSATAPTGKSYTINPSSYITSVNIPDNEKNKSTATTSKRNSEYDNLYKNIFDPDELLRKEKIIKNWLESLSNYETIRKDDYGME